MSATNHVEDTLQRHGYSTLPTEVEGSRLAVLHHGSNGTACADVLVFREINGRGETLRDEAALLVEALPRIVQQLSRQPDMLSPDAHVHAVAFLRKKVRVLVQGDGRPLRCHLFPLLILSSTTASRAAIHRCTATLPVIPAGQLDQFIARHRATTRPKSPAIGAWLLHFRRSHQLLGAALIAFPSLLGLSLLLASLGWLAAGMLTFTIAALSSPMFLIRALTHFRCFEHENPSGVHMTQERSPLASAGSPEDSAVHRDNPLSSPPAQDEEQITPWTRASTAAFLSDSMQSALTACLSTYQAANWRGYAGHLSSLLCNGIRLAILERTGQILPLRTSSLLDQLPTSNARAELDAWFHRLAAARQAQPLTTIEAQQAGHFVVQSLRELNVMPATWAAQILRVIPRPCQGWLPAGSLGNPSPPEAVIPANVSSQINPLNQQGNSITHPTTARHRLTTTASATVGPTATRKDAAVSTTMGPLDALNTQGAPLNVVSDRDLDLLTDMVRAGASPYLFVFGNRYLAHWKTLRQTIDQAAQMLHWQVNVVVFPGLGDQKVNSKVEEFFHRFRVEGASVPSALPLICALSRTVLLHVLEDNLPIPSELVVDPSHEGFLDRVQVVLRTAQAYQVNLQELNDEDDANAKRRQLKRNPACERSISQSVAPSGSPNAQDSAPRPMTQDQLSRSLVTNVDEVVEEVDSAQVSPQNQRVVEIDVEAALHGRELATMLPVALAVVHLPEDQHVLDALEAASKQEEYLIAEYVDSSHYPKASEALQIEAGTVRLRYNGREQLLQVPAAEHLVASVRQLRATGRIKSTLGQSVEATTPAGTLDSSEVSGRAKRSRAGQPHNPAQASAATQLGG